MASVFPENSNFVLVEWDDGSMQSTLWYLGRIVQYEHHKPMTFQDLGIDADQNEFFKFASHLMHHYMMLKDGDQILAKPVYADSDDDIDDADEDDDEEEQQRTFEIRINGDSIRLYRQSDGSEFDLSRNRFELIGPMEKDRCRLIDGPGSVDETLSSSECEEEFVASTAYKRHIDDKSMQSALPRKRRRVTIHRCNAAVDINPSDASEEQSASTPEDVDSNVSLMAESEPHSSKPIRQENTSTKNIAMGEAATRKKTLKRRQALDRDKRAVKLAQSLLRKFQPQQQLRMPEIAHKVSSKPVNVAASVTDAHPTNHNRNSTKHVVQTLTYEHRYESPFVVQKSGAVWFCSNFDFDTLPRGQCAEMQCELLATGDMLCSTQVQTQTQLRHLLCCHNYFGLLIDRNASLQIDHEYSASRHWLSIHLNNGVRFKLGHAQPVRVSEWHRCLTQSQYALYPGHEYVDGGSRLWNVGDPLQTVRIASTFKVHIPGMLDEKTMVVVSMKNACIPEYATQQQQQKRVKISSLVWLQLIEMDAFLSCNKNVILCEQLMRLNAMNASEQKQLFQQLEDVAYHKQLQSLSQIYALECTPQFLMKYGTNIHVNTYVSSSDANGNYKFLSALRTEDTQTFGVHSNFLVLTQPFSYLMTKNGDMNSTDDSLQYGTTTTTTTACYDEEDEDVDDDTWMKQLKDLRWRELTEVCRYLNLRVAGTSGILTQRVVDWVKTAKKNLQKQPRPKQQQQPLQEHVTPLECIENIIQHIGYIQKFNNIKLGSVLRIFCKQQRDAYIEGIVCQMQINGHDSRQLQCRMIITKLESTFIELAQCKLNESMLCVDLVAHEFDVDIYNNVLQEYYDENKANNLFNAKKKRSQAHRDLFHYYKSTYDVFQSYSFCKISIFNTIFIQ